MKKIDFVKQVLPHLVAILVFLVMTVSFFNPAFFEDKTMEQHDILQFRASAKSVMDYREETGKEALWDNSMFSGMPAYLISVVWDNQPVAYLKMVLSLGLPHPYCNIFLAFLCYYIMLLAFGVRPYLAIAGGLAFGLSSYMILGLEAGHNGRIGAIAFMPLAIAGIHLALTNRKLLGFGVATIGMALHLRENHLQITYYMMMIVLVYGLVRLVDAIIQKQLGNYLKGFALLVVAAGIAFGSFFGQLWSITEYTRYSIRGPSEIAKPGTIEASDGLPRDYTFQYKYGIYEPMTLLVPSFYGGSSRNYFVQDENSATYDALMNKGDNKTNNQLAQMTGAYWGPQGFTAGPYYAGAIIIFLFVLGILFADRKYVIWLVPLSALSLMISWGDSFPSFNYFLFDHLPGYNKFRSVNFALIIILFSMPLLGLLGVEKLWSGDLNKTAKTKLLAALSIVGGLCLLLFVFAGMGTFGTNAKGMSGLPGWFKDALAADRASLFRMDAGRSLLFIGLVFCILYFELYKKITAVGAALAIVALVGIDLATADKRYFTEKAFKDAEEETFLNPNTADLAIAQDKTSYRVADFTEPFGTSARAASFHQSIGGYHGAKMKRYQEFYDSCFAPQAQKFTEMARAGKMDLGIFQAANMLNVKYLMFGDKPGAVLPNNMANGNGWFVQKVVQVNSATEELKETGKVDTKSTAVIDVSKFKVPQTGMDSTASITLVEHRPDYLKYKVNTKNNGLAVFSEIYYPKGWKASIDGHETEILRADYILRALPVTAGEHIVEFNFKPAAYYTGNKITQAFSWVALLVLLGCVGWSLKEEKKKLPAETEGATLDHNVKK